MSDIDMNVTPQQQQQVQASKRKYSSGSESKSVDIAEGSIKRVKADLINEKPAQLWPKAATTAPLVQLRGNKLVLKQKPIEWSRNMSSLTAILAFGSFLKTCNEPLSDIPQEHLHTIAKLTQESDKNLNDVSKVIKSFLAPATDGGSSDEESQEGIRADQVLTIESIKKAVEVVADRVNYGVDEESIPSDHSVPAGLQIWRWEVRDEQQLASDSRDKILARRAERVRARTEAKALLEDLPEEERSALLLPSKKKTSKVEAPAASEPTPLPKEPVVLSKSKDVIVIDDDDDNNEGFKTPSPRKKMSEPTSKGSAEASGSISREASPSKTSRKKTLTPEQEAKQAEKEAKKKEREAKKQEKAEKDAEKEAKKQKKLQETARAASFLSNFIRPRSASPVKAEVQAINIQSDFDRVFQTCLYKDLAPINRFLHTAKGKGTIEGLGENKVDSATLLTEFTGEHRRGRRGRGGIHPPISVRESMRLITEASVMGDERLEEDGKKGLANLSDRSKIPMKLLHFESDRRPAWYGTWTRTTNLVRGRKPLCQDPVALDYSYDSDAEWEDVDPNDGDDVQDNDDKEEDDGDRSDEDSEMDDWLVDDLEEEEDEGSLPPDVDDFIPFNIKSETKAAAAVVFGKGTPDKTKIVNDSQPKKKKIKPLGRRFESKLIPFSTGPHWEDVVGECKYDGFKGYQIEFLNDAQPGLNPFTFVSADWTLAVETKASETTNGDTAPKQDASTTTKAANGAPTSTTASAVALAKAQLFSEELLPALLKTIEGSISIRPVLVEELKTKFGQQGKGATKTVLDACINVYAEKLSKKLGNKWVIKSEYRSKAGLNPL